MKRDYLLALVAVALISVTTIAQADLVNFVDPVGGNEIDNELGNLSLAAFEALTPTVQDWEGAENVLVGDNVPFSIGGVNVTGLYGETEVEWKSSGFRCSFTALEPAFPNSLCNRDLTTGSSLPSEDRTLVGNAMQSAGGGGVDDHAEWNFAGEEVLAVGLAWVGRDNRSFDPTITGKVTYGDGATETVSLTVDGDGSGRIGKDTFFGFLSNGSGITQLRVDLNKRHFNGWDDIGVVTASSNPSLGDLPDININSQGKTPIHLQLTNVDISTLLIGDPDLFEIGSPVSPLMTNDNGNQTIIHVSTQDMIASGVLDGTSDSLQVTGQLLDGTFFSAIGAFSAPSGFAATTAVPEPSSLILLGLGGMGLMFRRKR